MTGRRSASAGRRGDRAQHHRAARTSGTPTSPSCSTRRRPETLIANSAAAYRDLPEPLRAFADTLRAEHTNDYDCAKAPETLDEAEAEVPHGPPGGAGASGDRRARGCPRASRGTSCGCRSPTQHYAVDNYDDLPRRLNRVTVAGDVPVGIDALPSESLEGDASHYSPVA
ncbi:hypothetical protein LCL61_16590 [Amycolatopsis coloradensis]|uniref:Uncharacterized protein n=1 Tax=Amycolatopsis coloradensis TaxID=76021 RepID=A0ACD5BD86_9PSEU